MNLLQKIFSARNNNKHKIITILGIKIKSKFLKNDIDNLKILVYTKLVTESISTLEII